VEGLDHEQPDGEMAPIEDSRLEHQTPRQRNDTKTNWSRWVDLLKEHQHTEEQNTPSARDVITSIIIPDGCQLCNEKHKDTEPE
jgi:hypothetical protein